jgi:hypothetical protein
MMSTFFRIAKFVALFAVALTLASAPRVAHAQAGAVHLKIVKAGFIIGFGGGSGTLVYHGRVYHLEVGGVGIGSLGIAGAELRGVAQNLHNPYDIAGTYGAAGAGGTFVGGASAVRLQNDKGVVLELHGAQMGFHVNLSLGGMTISVR